MLVPNPPDACVVHDDLDIAAVGLTFCRITLRLAASIALVQGNEDNYKGIQNLENKNLVNWIFSFKSVSFFDRSVALIH